MITDLSSRKMFMSQFNVDAPYLEEILVYVYNGFLVNNQPLKGNKFCDFMFAVIHTNPLLNKDLFTGLHWEPYLSFI